MHTQLQLFEQTRNPLQKRLGKKFFDALPKEPGVYLMYDRSGRLLYVGKAKNLRRRLFAYRRISSLDRSKKSRRLVCNTHGIEIRILDSEEAALLEENRLIRLHRPEFNRAKKSPETYYFLSMAPEENGWQFRLGMSKPQDPVFSGHTYGAFKGHRTVRSGAGALLRLLYMLEYEVQNPFDFPGILTQKLTPLQYRLPASEGVTLSKPFRKSVHQCLSGSSLSLFYLIVKIITERDLLNRPIGRLLLNDIELLKTFYDRCSERNSKLIKTLSLPGKLIPQHKLDDYLIQAAFRED